jgi:biopolymer transport protein ExbD
MAELNTGGGGGGHKGGKVRSKKQSTRVDLTAMVDLAFLLITFFMLTTTLLKPQAMDLFMPDKDKDQKEKFDFADNRTMTILLGSGDRVEWYMGTVDKPQTPTVDNYGRDGIRKVIIAKKKAVLEATKDPKKGLLILIKPSDKSNYKNLVDILDEMKISEVPTYAIVDITSQEVDGLLKRDNIY